MIAPLASVFAVALMIAAGSQDDASKPNGSWILVEGEQDGKPLPQDVQGAKMVIDGEKHTLMPGPVPVRGQ